jgi:LmbE family N-acetylglucosaminyl deacetylase
MKTISRRSMLHTSGLTAIGSMIAIPVLSGKRRHGSASVDKLKILVAGAHPDDPESGCGGTMALYAAAGHEVVSAYLTRGEAGIAGKSHDEAADIRTREAISACSILKARPEFLGQIDGSTEITAARYQEMHAFIQRENPDIVFTHWPIDTHRDHRICSMLVYDAWLNLGKSFALCYFEVESGFQSQNFNPSVYINISGVADQKLRACMAHVSQDPEDFYMDIHRKMEKFRGMESGCDAAEAFVQHNHHQAIMLST